ncbi:probable transmembrane ascorbate ferrireductase 4 isoform X1 [Spinacia oleracea]|uniref:Probable transmembrane ascorbate ferrireductase 4 isoform X1 n=1 Tax=Spinacia oleracea TaxID=3562 RepID=A0ABM3RLU9_SPIOL|nr:probable transmembrane ascorbate ferrireductase 4 isoform X1 [Spinacia oleracea]
MSCCTPPVVVYARISGVLVAALVLIWPLFYNNSFTHHSPSSPNNFIFSVLHPLLMVIGFIIISGEAILVHRWMPGSRNMKKTVHLGMQGVALASGIFGIWTKFQPQNGVVANFYTLHSWMGFFCVTLFAIQRCLGFYT